MINEVKHLLIKEFRSDLKSRSSVAGMLVYVASTLFVCYFSFQGNTSQQSWVALFWIIILFSSINALVKSFIQENDARMNYLHSMVSGTSVILSKMLYYGILLLLLSFFTFGTYSLIMGSFVQNYTLLFVVLFLGSLGLSATLSLMSAISSKAGRSSSLMAILSLPLLIPLLLILLRLSKHAVEGYSWDVSWKYILALGGLDMMVIMLALLLFPYLWRD